MLLAVAGLTKEQVKERARGLSDNKWTLFPEVERVGYRFVHQQATQPTKISDEQIKALKKAMGPHRALDVIWYGSWCNYMTRVADAFQLPLEKSNVFGR